MAGVPTETLDAVAKQAAGEFLSDGTDLSTAVVKAASLIEQPLTDEHVRRICERALHEAFEGAYHAKAGSGDRYVSFDPPDPVLCAAELHALPLHVPPRPPAGGTPALSVLKAASAPARKYVPVDPIDRAFPTQIEKHADAWAQPLRELCDLREAAKEAERFLASESGRLDAAGNAAMHALVAQADQACKEGATIPLVLHVCAAGAPGLGAVSTDVLRDVGEHLFSRGYADGDTKLAASMVPNPDHPLPQLFFKVASLRSERAHIEIALSEARANFADVSRQIAALCH